MRVLSLSVLAVAVLVSGAASATDWNSLMATDPDARWNACYKETRLLYRTKNMSEQQYRVAIKDARRDHMKNCMARAQPPRPFPIPAITQKKRPAQIAGWSANP